MIRKIVIAVCALVLVAAFGVLAHHEVFTFRWTDLFDPFVVKAMWSWLDQVRLPPRSRWLISACLVAIAAQVVALVNARWRHRRWRAIQQAVVLGDWGVLGRLPGSRLQIALGATWLLIPLAAAFSVAEARASVLQAFDPLHPRQVLLIWRPFQSQFYEPPISDLMNGQMAAIGAATLATLLAVLVGGLTWSLELSMVLRTRGLKAAARVAPIDASTAAAQAASPGPGPMQTATLIYTGIVLGAVPFALGIWAFLWRLYAGHAASYATESPKPMTADVLAYARHTLETAAWVQLASALLAGAITLGLLARWRRRWPKVIAWSGQATWGRAVLCSSLCLVTAALCLLLAYPMAAENRAPWPPKPLLVRTCSAIVGDGLEGVDAVEPGVSLVVGRHRFEVEGDVGDVLETADNLIAQRRNFQPVHPTETQGRVLIDCPDHLPAERLQEALSAVARAGYAEVQLCMTTGEILHRPTLGAISRWKTSAARARIEDGPAMPSQAVRFWPTGTCQQARQRIFELRRAGHEVVLVPPEKTPAERQAEALRFKAAAADEEAASAAARESKPPACSANQIAIPSATFSMGSESGATDAKPVHQVTLSAFCIDRTEVPVAAYRACVEARGCSSPKRIGDPCAWSPFERDEQPMDCVNWSEAGAFCKWAGGRLPTEAEWERAARAKDARLSMTGRIWEWTIDDYTEYGPEPVTNPKGTLNGASRRVARGRSKSDGPPSQIDTTTRERFNPGRSEPDLGFRCVRGPLQDATEWQRPDLFGGIPK